MIVFGWLFLEFVILMFFIDIVSIFVSFCAFLVELITFINCEKEDYYDIYFPNLKWYEKQHRIFKARRHMKYETISLKTALYEFIWFVISVLVFKLLLIILPYAENSVN